MNLLVLIILFSIARLTVTNSVEVHEDQTSIASLSASRSKYAVEWSELIVSSGRKRLVNFTAGYVSSGRLLGIIGPSGSGKSTFLKALSNRLSNKLKIRGSVQITSFESLNPSTDSKGRKLTEEEVAYVYQDDNFFGMLTVYETLKLAIDLQRNSDIHRKSAQAISEESDEAIITEVLRVMGLTKVAHIRVGGASIGGDQSHGISGGERKRLAVACELLSNPLVLIADEPTSGLDSFQALQVMQILQTLSQKRQMITICVVHQPRSTIWNLFDDVMILTPFGEIAYFGSREKVLPYFQSLGYPCPENTNPAEYLIDLVSINSTSTQFSEKSIERANHLADSYREYWKSKKDAPLTMSSVSQSGDDSTDPGSKKWSPSSLQPFKDKSKSTKSFSLSQLPSTIYKSFLLPFQHSCVRFLLLFQRSARQLLRDRQTNLFRILISGLLAFVVSGVYGYQGRTIQQGSVADRINIIAQGNIIMAMFSTIKTLQLFKKEKLIIDRERSQSLYSSLEYLLAKSFVELPADALMGAIFGYLLYQKTSLHSTKWRFIAVLSLLSAVCSSLGLAIGALAPSGDVALTIGPGLMVIYVILGAIGPAGVNAKKLPAALVPFRRYSPMKWACEALTALEFRGQSFGTEERDVPHSKAESKGSFLKKAASVLLHPIRWLLSKILNPTKVETEGDKVMKALGIPDATYQEGVTVLLKMLFGHLGLALIGLIISKSKGF